MRIVISGDWQAALGNLDRLGMVVDQVVDEVKKQPKTFFIHLGDTKESFNPVDVRVYNFLQDAFTRIRKSCAGFYYVRGNHDSINTQDGSPSICDFVSALGALAVADASWETVEIPLLNWRGISQRRLCMYFVPYFRDPKRQRDEFKGPLEHIRLRRKAGKDDIRLLFFHNTVTGCRQSLHTEGVGLSAEDIGASEYNACFAGHIHLAQELKPNIHVVGSPMPMDWGEANYRHRIMSVTIPEGKHA